MEQIKLNMVSFTALSCVILSAFALPSTNAGTSHEVNISGLRFSPSTLTISKGDTVKWNFNSITHSVTQGEKDSCKKISSGFDSGDLLGPQIFEKTFSDAGTFYYYCAHGPHCILGMKASVTVV